ALMEFSNTMSKFKAAVYQTEAWREAVQTFLLLIAPACPHIAEEMWSRLGFTGSAHQQAWPQSDPELAAEENIEIVLQVNGKIREKLVVPVGSTAAQLQEIALASETVQKNIEGKTVRKVIAVPDRLVNIVVG
ncbi:MAG TPA: class I tRNA ligase family protein, partial [Bacillota bacterium]|nr:class I tRNA ligase family protein [Bacillota bacterium]